MKTIIDGKDLISYFLYPNEQVITKTENGFIVERDGLSDLHILENDYILIEGVGEPTNYKAAKYKVIDGEWVLNPFYLPTE